MKATYTYKKTVLDDGGYYWAYHYLDGYTFHSLVGPAVWKPNGFQQWVINGRCHRDDGPAFISANGSVERWLRHGVNHRWDGPAYVDHVQEHEEWWVNGMRVDDIIDQITRTGLVTADWRHWTDTEKVIARLALSATT